MTGTDEIAELEIAALPDHTAHLLSLLYVYDQTSDLHWSVWGGRVSFFMACSDTFVWGTADAEGVDSTEDVELLAKCFADLRECGDYMEVYGPELYAARKRGMRPMRLWLGTHPSQLDGSYKGRHGAVRHNPKAQALFLACGPERDPRSEG